MQNNFSLLHFAVHGESVNLVDWLIETFDFDVHQRTKVMFWAGAIHITAWCYLLWLPLHCRGNHWVDECRCTGTSVCLCGIAKCACVHINFCPILDYMCRNLWMLFTLLPMVATWRLSSTSCPNLEKASLTWTALLKTVSTRQYGRVTPKWYSISLRREGLTPVSGTRWGGKIAH